ncbi:hypothetical protein HerbRD11066_67830 [Herbidospora sp. RD11066]
MVGAAEVPDEHALSTAVLAASSEAPPIPDRKARREKDEGMAEAFLGVGMRRRSGGDTTRREDGTGTGRAGE